MYRSLKLSKDIEVEANSLVEARDKIEQQYKNGDIVLYAEDYGFTDFNVTEIYQHKKRRNMER